jgi:uncharacterized delta-60 repeat protein/uncharacterized repeat protein (TIGR01451 family)
MESSVERLENRTLLSAGALDPNYGTSGIEKSLGGIGELNGMVFQNGGEVVAVGNTVGISYTTSGDEDGRTTFGASGTVQSVATQSTGKTVVAGYANIGVDQFIMVRFNADGTADSTFGNAFGFSGLVTTNFGADNARAVDMIVKSDNSIVVLGGVRNAANNIKVGLARYNFNGGLAPILDTAFGLGSSGTSFDISGATFDGFDGQLAIGPDGKYVVVVQTASSTDFVVARFDTNGQLDTSFGAAGSLATDFFGGTDKAENLAVLSDGIIVVGRSTSAGNSTYAMAKYNVIGNPAGFGVGGKVTGSTSTTSSFEGVAIQADGKIVAVGSVGAGSDQKFLVARFKPDGSLDTSFDTDGLATTGLEAGNHGFASEVLIQSNGKIVVGGSIIGATTAASGFALARYEAAEPVVFPLSPNTIVPVSKSRPLGGATVTANDSSSLGSVSADGRYVVYTSSATNIVNGQVDYADPVSNNHFTDVFLFDSVTNTTKLVSGSRGSTTVTGNNSSASSRPRISADGNYVAFNSFASDLVVGQNELGAVTNDLFLYDVRLGTTTLVSHTHNSATTPANGAVNGGSSISADGRFIAFSSYARDHINDFSSPFGDPQVFLFDRLDSSIKLVSRSVSSATTAGDYSSFAPSISADGRYVAFVSYANDLVTGQNDNGTTDEDLFLFDAITNSMTLITGTVGSTTTTANGRPLESSISGDGRFVAFQSLATDLVSSQVSFDTNNVSDVFLFDRLASPGAGRLQLVSHADIPSDPNSRITAATGGTSNSAIINTDGSSGSFVLFQSTATNLVAGVTDNNSARDLFLFNVSTGSNTLVSHALDSDTTTANAASGETIYDVSSKAISAQGDFIAYSSAATNLVTGVTDNNSAVDAFFYNRSTGKSSLLSGANSSTTVPGSGGISHVTGISADGSAIVIESRATNLISGDTNLRPDIFLSLPPLTLTYEGKLRDGVSREDNVRNGDGVLDGTFTVTFPPGIGSRTVTSLTLERNGDSNRWNTIADETWILAAADSIDASSLYDSSQPAFSQPTVTINVPEDGAVADDRSFVIYAADFAGNNSFFTAGKSFTLTVGFSDGTSAKAQSDPIPVVALSFDGRLRDRVGRSETSLSGDGKLDGTFTMTLPPGSGTITSLELDRGDGVRWNTTSNDPYWVLGVATSLDSSPPLLNTSNGTLPTGLSFTDGGSRVLFAPEDRPEAASFFAVGKTFTLTVGFADGSTAVGSVTITSVPLPAQFQFSANTYQAREEVETALIRVNRTGDTTTAVSVEYFFTDGTAYAGYDYTATNGRLDFAAGETSKTFIVPITWDADLEPDDETFSIGLRNPSDGGEVGTPGSTTFKIFDGVPPVADLSIAVIATGVAQVGEEYRYTLKMTNDGPDPALGLLLLHPIDENVRFERVVGDGCSVNVSKTILTCAISQLGVFAQEVDVTVYPVALSSTSAPVTSFEIKAVVVSNSTDNNKCNNTNYSEPVGCPPLPQQVPTVQVRPANDSFLRPTFFPSDLSAEGGVTLRGTNKNATHEVILGDSEPFHANKTGLESVWYSWTAPYTGWVTFKTDGSVKTDGSEFDTLLAVYRTNEGRLTPVVAGDDQLNPVPPPERLRTEEVSFIATEGRVYLIVVDGFKRDTGNIQINGKQNPRQVPGVVNSEITNYSPFVTKKDEPFSLVVNGQQFTAQHKIRVNGQVLESTTFVNSTRLDVQVPASFTDNEGVLAVEVASTTEVAKNIAIIRVINWSVGSGAPGQTATASTSSGSHYTLQATTSVQADCGFLLLNCVATAAVNATGQALRRVGEAVVGAGRAVAEVGQAAGSAIANTVGRVIGGHSYSVNTSGATEVRAIVTPQIVAGGGGNAIPDDAIMIGIDAPTLIANDGASLIGQGGTTLIGQDGASLIGNGGSTFAAPSATRLASSTGASDWIIVRGSGAAAPTITNTTNPDGTVTGSMSFTINDTTTPSIADLANGMIFLIVVPDKVQFDASNYSVSEGGGQKTITVTRTGTLDGQFSVDYAITGGTATAGTDFTASTGTLIFADGQATKTFTVPIHGDTEAEANETINLVLSNPQGIVSIGTQSSAVLTILNNQAPVLNNTGTPYLIAPAGTRLATEMSNGILISDLLVRGAGGNPITDPDSGAVEGIALTAVNKIDGSFGTWEFTLVANPQASDWTNVETTGALSDSSALLLPADANARLRFVTTLMPRHNTQASDGTPRTPAQGFLPLETKLDTGITFRAWDRTAGTSGGRADTTTNGGATAFSTATETAGTYFETRLFRSFNTAAQLNTYTLEQEFNALINVFGYQDRSTSDYSGFTILMSPIPGVTTAALYRMYFGIAFDSPVPGVQTDMGYRYLTTDLGEAQVLETLGPAAHRADRDGFYFRELGVNSGTGITGYIYTTAQPGTSEMVQIYRTDLFSKDTRTGPPGSPATGTVLQQQGDHAYTTKSTFEMSKTGSWRQESPRGFVRELSPNAGGAAAPARSASVQSGIESQTAPVAANLIPESSSLAISAGSRLDLSNLMAPLASGQFSAHAVVVNETEPLPASPRIRRSPLGVLADHSVANSIPAHVLHADSTAIDVLFTQWDELSDLLSAP